MKNRENKQIIIDKLCTRVSQLSATWSVANVIVVAGRKQSGLLTKTTSARAQHRVVWCFKKYKAISEIIDGIQYVI